MSKRLKAGKSENIFLEQNKKHNKTIQKVFGLRSD